MLDKGFANVNLQKKVLDASWLKHELISNNIANINTPGYKRQDIAFEDMLKDFLTQRKLDMMATNSAHYTLAAGAIGELNATIISDKSTSQRLDGNNVNIDLEMAEQAKNSIKYNAVVTQINAQLRRMKSAIKGGI